MHYYRHQTAFTLIELLIALAIIGLLASTAAPALAALISRAQLNAFTQQALNLLTASRLEAVSRGRPISWCPLNEQRQCQANEATRLVVFEDLNDNQILEENERIIAQAPLSPHQKVVMNNKTTVQFLHNGRTHQPASLYFCHGEIAQKVTISFIGRIYLKEETAPQSCPP